MKTKLLFNPFTRVAGWHAFGIGMAAMALTAIIGACRGVIFDGALDAHVIPHTLAQAFTLQGVDFLSLFLCLWLAGAIFSRTKYRIIDVAGTAALGRLPMLLLVLFSLLPIVPATLADKPRMVVFTLLSLLAVIWMVALLYNGYSVGFNLRGTRGTLSFAGAVVVAETISKAVLLLLLTGTPLSGNASNVERITIPEGQTIQQTARMVVDALQKGDYSGASTYFDQQMRIAVPTGKLKTVWESVIMSLGGFVKADTNVQPAEYDKYRVMVIPCTFKKGVMSLQLTFDPDGYISGLYIK